MSTQKQKFALFQRLQNLGFTYEEAAQLRRIEMTLHRWAELECGDGNEWGSWAIERDETTEKPFMVRHHYRHGRGKDTMTRYAIADREAGALRRLGAIMASKPSLVAYHQTDPRGCALYIVHRPGLVEGATHEESARELHRWLESNYSRGLAVCC